MHAPLASCQRELTLSTKSRQREEASDGLKHGSGVFYYCMTYYKAVRVGGGGEWRTCAMRDDEPRPVWMSLPITRWDREEPGTLTQGAPVFPGSSRLGIEPKTPGWLVQDPTTR